jgi:hypothetical protein
MRRRNRLRKRRQRLRIFEVLEERQMLVSDLQNQHNQFDVNADMHVSPLDALIVINHISRHSDRVVLSAAEGEGQKLYPDTNGDRLISPIDALLVINELNAEAESPGEAINTTGFVGVSLVHLPGDATEIVELDFTVSVTSGQLREVGLFVMDNGTGAVQGVSPQHANYAHAVLSSNQHQQVNIGAPPNLQSATRPRQSCSF